MLPFLQRSGGGTICSAAAVACGRLAELGAFAGVGASAALPLEGVRPASVDVGSARKCRRPPYQACTPQYHLTT